MKALVYHGVVIQIQETSFEVHPNYQWIDCDETVETGYLYQNGVFIEPQPEPLSLDDQLNVYRAAVQEQLELKAHEKGYSTSLSLVSYSDSSNDIWRAEAHSFILWRDAIYDYSLAVLNDVQQGGQAPTLPDFISGLPTLTWPS